MHYTSKEVYEFISKQTNDPIVERKTCAVSGQLFPIYQSDLDFYAKISPTFAGQKFAIPTPTLCPEERQRRRLSFRNERKLYKRKCDATGENIISIYSPDKPHKVYKQDFWRSDKRDPMDYGREFDFSRTFSEQFNELMMEVPTLALVAKMTENSDYVNGCGYVKNCYLIFDCDFCEDSIYSGMIKHSKNIVDSTNISYSEIVYNSVNCSESYHLFDCIECDQSKFLYDCKNCSSCEFCIGCNNLVGKKYCINNVQYSKEEFNEKSKSYQKNSNIALLQRATYKVNDEGSSGNNLYKTKNCKLSNNIALSEYVSYCDLITDVTNSYDISSFGGTTQRSIDCCSIGQNCSNIYYGSVITVDSYNLLYCSEIIGSSNLFGCIGLRNKQYCIFNKQYSKENYEKTVAKIITHMQETGERGEFFNPSLSPFGYNETVAQEYFPLTKDQAKNFPIGGSSTGFKRQDHNYDPVIPEGANVIDRKTTTNDPTEDEQILKAIFVCEVSGRPYRIIKQELDFYRKHNLPLPRKHPDVRHEERMKLRPGRTLYLRKCDKTGEEMLSVYPADYPGKVYSEKAYQEEVFG